MLLVRVWPRPVLDAGARDGGSVDGAAVVASGASSDAAVAGEVADVGGADGVEPASVIADLLIRGAGTLQRADESTVPHEGAVNPSPGSAGAGGAASHA